MNRDRSDLDHDDIVAAIDATMVSATPGAQERSVAGVGRVALWIALAPTLWILFGSRLASYGMDSAHAYWNVWRVGPYSLPPGSPDAFNYTPAFAQAIYPLTLLPWPVFLTVWSVLLGIALVWLLWPVSPRWRWLLLAYVAPPALLIGNIEAFLAVAAVVGMRRPTAWAFPLLTKVTPGLGPVWFAVRREWRHAAVAVLGTLAIAAVSWAVSPDLWLQWWDFIVGSPTPPTQSGYPPLVLRLGAALLVLVWGALKGRRRTIPVAMALAMPLWSSGVLVLLTALPRMRHDAMKGDRLTA
ncbi:glycosyltransferase family 87 protein [Terracoccus sp. 273MFTsu3.1]|uniref:glycosyltransferase family 87 protein n=1 Tax=Terracoccus sp. 273MFTsu3.1 TaxID=1172188 RepID=UPI0003619FD2|nr:glycosyltransferase family 87 protein [Terracoccus sp. 273MFTsu3.1]